jgi:hypothetical protein
LLSLSFPVPCIAALYFLRILVPKLTTTSIVLESYIRTYRDIVEFSIINVIIRAISRWILNLKAPERKSPTLKFYRQNINPRSIRTWKI